MRERISVIDLNCYFFEGHVFPDALLICFSDQKFWSRMATWCSSPGINVIKVFLFITDGDAKYARAGNAKGGSIIVPLTSFLTGLESAV